MSAKTPAKTPAPTPIGPGAGVVIGRIPPWSCINVAVTVIPTPPLSNGEVLCVEISPDNTITLYRS